MPSVTSSAASPYEAIGTSRSSPLIQMEAKGFVMRGAQSAYEGLHGMLPVKPMNYEATSSMISTAITSIYEILLTVKAVF